MTLTDYQTIVAQIKAILEVHAETLSIVEVFGMLETIKLDYFQALNAANS